MIESSTTDPCYVKCDQCGSEEAYTPTEEECNASDLPCGFHRVDGEVLCLRCAALKALKKQPVRKEELPPVYVTYAGPYCAPSCFFLDSSKRCNFFAEDLPTLGPGVCYRCKSCAIYTNIPMENVLDYSD